MEQSEIMYKEKYLKYKKKYLDAKIKQEGGSCIKWKTVIDLLTKNTKNQKKNKPTVDKSNIKQISSLTSNIIYRFLLLNKNTTNTFINGEFHIIFIPQLIKFINIIVEKSAKTGDFFDKICRPYNDWDHNRQTVDQKTFYYKCLKYALLNDIPVVPIEFLSKPKEEKEKMFDEIHKLGTTYNELGADNRAHRIDKIVVPISNFLGNFGPKMFTVGHTDATVTSRDTSIYHRDIKEFLQRINQNVLIDLRIIQDTSIYNIKIVDGNGIKCDISKIGKNVIDILMSVFMQKIRNNEKKKV